ncbi:MAG: hypothetical protein AB1736_12015 [Chloroflexota bacterium]
MATLTIQDRTATGRPVDSFTIEDLPDRITVRDLIRTRVRDEVARYNLRPLEMFRGLVAPTDAEQTVGGYRLRKPRTLDWEKQADIAIDAFGRNGFFVLVNGRQATELDQEISVSDAADVAFVKLVQLVGG